MRQSAALVALTVLAGALVSAYAQEAAAPAPAAAAAAPAKTCKTALDLIASQNMNLPVHPVFQNILNSEHLKGTLFIPTTKAWDSFFATMRQRQGNPAAPAMVARYGQILLYHLAKDVQVPVADATPGINKFAVDTASTLQCTFGPGLPNNRLVIKKTPEAIIVQHGTGNATIMSQKIQYCGGEAYLVDQVLNPCSDIAAIMGEIANIPSPCKSNVEGVLNKNELTYFNALLLATGVQRPIFSSVRNFTLFVPSDEAIQNAIRSGALNYPYLYAKNATLLEGIVAYHAVPQFQFAGPSKQTLSMKTLLTEGTGEAQCSNPSISWRPDGFVYGGTGSARVSESADRGCNTQIRVIDEVLQPCCKPMADLIGGPSGLAAKAPKGSIQAKAYQYLLSKVKDGAAGTTFIMPSADAWAQFEADATAQKVNLTNDKLEVLFSYLSTSAPITANSLAAGAQVPMNLAAAPNKSIAALCPAGTNATIAFATDTSAQLPAVSDTATAARTQPAPAAAMPAAAYPSAAVAPTAGFAPAATGPAAFGAAPGFGAGAAPALPAAAPAAAPGFGRKLAQAAGATAPASDLLLPTTYVAKPDPTVGSGAATSAAAAAGPVVLVDGQEMELRAGLAIPVSSMTYSCDGAIYNTDAVPLPCNVLNRTVVLPPPPPQVNLTDVAPAVAAADAANITAAAKSAAAAAAAAPLVGSLMAAVLFAALLL
ncbi:hypothetical protein OEZ85_011494 [Tetradesmus obliquus]|uniref:FAS1 domain-containing protein n=1 Tax=Tetradesmus obliquus TaxID=3088 RepID=A0ABY8TV54_TETOB|nr:hypothetical protein OEZ85_011494 [Tetradesmus obliquus]